MTSRPLAPRALAWSCDAELAVAADDAICIFIPEYPKLKQDADGENVDDGARQFSLALQTSGIIKPDPAINARLCSFAGCNLPLPRIGEDHSLKGVGNGPITKSGSAVNQVVRLEWSPNGLGYNLRPVLTALMTSGSILTFGEDVDSRSPVNAGLRSRVFKFWRILWGLGADLPLPDATSNKGYRLMEERIKSFSWAGEIGPGRGLLAYSNDLDEIVIVSVHFHTHPQNSTAGTDESTDGWTIQPLTRIDGTGPHSVSQDASRSRFAANNL